MNWGTTSQGFTITVRPGVIHVVHGTIETTPTAIAVSRTANGPTVYELRSRAPEPIPWIGPEAFPVDELAVKRAASKQAHEALVDQARTVRPTSIATRARFGFQQAARLPCYRGVRAR